MTEPLVWAEVDLQAVAHNVRALKTMIGDDCRLMAVVKADGYGHGLCPVSETALCNGASALAVARIEEAIALREHGLTAPILILGYTPESSFPDLIHYDCCQTIWSPAEAGALSRAAIKAGKKVGIHVKIDTGMGRLGLTALPADSGASIKEAVRRTLEISGLPGLSLEGVFTHFADSGAPDKAYTRRQLDAFFLFSDHLKRAGLQPALRHAANSAAVIDMPATHLDLARAGIAIYGLYPSDHVRRERVALEPAMALKTRIIQIRQVPENFYVSYGATYTTPRPTTLAVVPVGYADGYNRLLSSRGTMLVSARRVPVVGRVCMDLTVLDVGGLDDVKVGDEVVVFGRQGEAVVPVEEIAAATGTINYEVVTAVTGRVPRRYLPGKKKTGAAG